MTGYPLTFQRHHQPNLAMLSHHGVFFFMQDLETGSHDAATLCVFRQMHLPASTLPSSFTLSFSIHNIFVFDVQASFSVIRQSFSKLCTHFDNTPARSSSMSEQARAQTPTSFSRDKVPTSPANLMLRIFLTAVTTPYRRAFKIYTWQPLRDLQAANGDRKLLIPLVRDWKADKYDELHSVQVAVSRSGLVISLMCSEDLNLSLNKYFFLLTSSRRLSVAVSITPQMRRNEPMF